MPLNLFKWVKANKNDTAFKGFYPKLVDHLLNRLLKDRLSIGPSDRAGLLILSNIIYYYKALRINYTTYNNQREQDTINPRTHSDIAMLSNDTFHPYCYARVIGIFHVMVRLNSPRSNQRELHRMEFLWVRWYNVDQRARAGFKAKRQFQVKFRTCNHDFGFVNPSDVLRAAHLLPNFAKGTTKRFLGPSFARRLDEKNEDYERYYVSMFADRDMFMQFAGGGVGHLCTRDFTRDFEAQMRDLWGSFEPEDLESESNSKDNNTPQQEPAVQTATTNQEAGDLEVEAFGSGEEQSLEEEMEEWYTDQEPSFLIRNHQHHVQKDPQRSGPIQPHQGVEMSNPPHTPRKGGDPLPSAPTNAQTASSPDFAVDTNWLHRGLPGSSHSNSPLLTPTPVVAKRQYNEDSPTAKRRGHNKIQRIGGESDPIPRLKTSPPMPGRALVPDNHSAKQAEEVEEMMGAEEGKAQEEEEEDETEEFEHGVETPRALELNGGVTQKKKDTQVICESLLLIQAWCHHHRNDTSWDPEASDGLGSGFFNLASPPSDFDPDKGENFLSFTDLLALTGQTNSLTKMAQAMVEWDPTTKASMEAFQGKILDLSAENGSLKSQLLTPTPQAQRLADELADTRETLTRVRDERSNARAKVRELEALSTTLTKTKDHLDAMLGEMNTLHTKVVQERDNALRVAEGLQRELSCALAGSVPTSSPEDGGREVIVPQSSPLTQQTQQNQGLEQSMHSPSKAPSSGFGNPIAEDSDDDYHLPLRPTDLFGGSKGDTSSNNGMDDSPVQSPIGAPIQLPANTVTDYAPTAQEAGERSFSPPLTDMPSDEEMERAQTPHPEPTPRKRTYNWSFPPPIPQSRKAADRDSRMRRPNRKMLQNISVTHPEDQRSKGKARAAPPPSQSNGEFEAMKRIFPQRSDDHIRQMLAAKAPGDNTSPRKMNPPAPPRTDQRSDGRPAKRRCSTLKGKSRLTIACFFTRHLNGEQRQDLPFAGDLFKLAKEVSNFMKVRRSAFVCRHATLSPRNSGLILHFDKPPAAEEFALVKNYFRVTYFPRKETDTHTVDIDLRASASKLFAVLTRVPHYDALLRPLTHDAAQLLLSRIPAISELHLAAKPRVVLLGDKRTSKLCNIFFEFWDSQSGNALKKLVKSLPVRVDGVECRFEAANVQTPCPQCNNCLTWGHVTTQCKQNHEICAICSYGHPTRHHREQAFCCKARPNANPPVLATPTGQPCPHEPRCSNCGKNHTAISKTCVFWRRRFVKGWAERRYAIQEELDADYTTTGFATEHSENEGGEQPTDNDAN